MIKELKEEYHPGHLIKGSDGRVTRLFRCECGTPVYRKDVTNNKYEIEVRPVNREQRFLSFESNGACDIKCPNPECKLSHIVLATKENISTVDSLGTTDKI